MTGRLILAMTLIATTVALSACANTARGIGRDAKNNTEATAKAVRGR